MCYLIRFISQKLTRTQIHNFFIDFYRMLLTRWSITSLQMKIKVFVGENEDKIETINHLS